jgi:uncharacterized membrane protein
MVLVLNVLGMVAITAITKAAQIFTNQTNAATITAFGIIRVVHAVTAPSLALSAAVTRTAARAKAEAVHGLAAVASFIARPMTMIKTGARKVDSVRIPTTMVNATSRSAVSSTVTKASANLL